MRKSELLEILYDWNFWVKQPDAGITREGLLNSLNKLLDIGEITVISGVRRSGKSTLLLQLCANLIKQGVRKEDVLVVNLEDPRLRNADLDLLNRIYETYLSEFNPGPGSYVVLDEVQVVSGWEKFARFLHENKKVRVLVTGSSSKLLSSEYSTVLSGRHVDMEVYPLPFADFLGFRGVRINMKNSMISQRYELKKALSDYLKWGGFPRIALINDETGKKELLGTYFTDIVIKDVVSRYRIKELQKLENLARYYLTNVSTLQSFNRIRKTLNLSLDSVERFSTYLSQAYLIFFVKKFSYSLKEQVLNPKKVYCVDTGLRNVSGFTFSRDLGRLAENAVFVKLKRDGNDIYYWRDAKQREVDFVVKSGGKVQKLIQVAWDVDDENVKKRETESLLDAMDEFSGAEGLVITEDYEDVEKNAGRTIAYKPLWKWLLE